MKLLVAVKRVIDPYVKVRVKNDFSGVEDNKMSMNPFDEIAVEEAIRLKEKGIASEVVVVSIGAESSQETLRTGLALGADRALLVKTEKSFEPINVAKILKSIYEREQPQLVLLGKQSIDGDNNQTGQMLASLLNLPQMTFSSKLSLEGATLTAVRELDEGLQTLTCQLPAVVTTDLRLNEPRYATLPNIMKSKRKPMEVIDLESLGLTLTQHLKVEKVSPPEVRSQGVEVKTVDELIAKLKEDAQVI